MKINLKKFNPLANTPVYATTGSACFDIQALFEGEPVLLFSGSTHIFGTGLAFEIPVGFAMMLFSRSGHGFNKDVRLGNCVGIIDSDYRGELMIKLTNDGHNDQSLTVNSGDRIAQAWVVPVEQVTFFETEDLTSTERGIGGLGSTG